MLLKFRTYFVTLALLMAPLIAWSNYETRTAREHAQDAKILTAIHYELTRDKLLSPLKVQAQVRQGHVSLRGRVHNRQEFARAILLTEAQDGVKTIDTRHLAIAAKRQDILSDTILTSRVKGRFLREKFVHPDSELFTHVSVSSEDGVVHLSGRVSNRSSYHHAINLAEGIAGMNKVNPRNLQISHRS